MSNDKLDVEALLSDAENLILRLREWKTTNHRKQQESQATTTKPEVMAYFISHKYKCSNKRVGVRLLEDHDPSCDLDDWNYEPLIRLSDYESLQAKCDSLVEALELISDTDPDEGTAWFHEIACKSLDAHRNGGGV